MSVYLFSQHVQRKSLWCRAGWYTVCAVCTCTRLFVCHTLPTEVECSCTSSKKFPSRLQSAMTDHRLSSDLFSAVTLQVRDSPEEQTAHTGVMSAAGSGGSFVDRDKYVRDFSQRKCYSALHPYILLHQCISQIVYYVQ